MKPLIIPTMLVKTSSAAKERLQLLGKTARWIQWDIMDGSLTPHTSWRDVETVLDWKIFPYLELHLMVKNPETLIRSWRRVSQVSRVIWHIEAPIDHARLIKQCQRWNLEVGLAISPHTPIAALIPFLRQIDTVLVLGVVPGENGASLIPATIQTVRDLKKLLPKLPIGFDGGIKPTNLLRLKRAGVTRFNIGSAIFQSTDPVKTLKQLQKKASSTATTRSRKITK